MYRIGIFDPAFRTEGHFIAFDKYIRDLLDRADISVTFIDQDGTVEEAYANTRFNQPHAYLRIAPEPRLVPFLPKRMGKILSRLLYWNRALTSIEKESFDLVLFTADPRDIAMCLFPLRFRYGIVIMYPYVFVTHAKRISAKFHEFLYKQFVYNSAVRFTTNEPPICANISELLGVTDIHWIPDLPAEEVARNLSTSTSFEFLTIGTISKTKNHAFTLNVFEDYSLPFSYIVAGKATDRIGRDVEERTRLLTARKELNITGIFEYLTETKYQTLMQQAQFLIFPYDLTRGNISSQVLHDAFSIGIPFIAPNIEPFRWYVERYNIGLLYKEGDPESCAAAIKKAHEIGPAGFFEGFVKLRAAHSLSAIKEQFAEALDPIISR